MNSDDVWNFICGVGVGIVIGGLLTLIGLGLTNRKFCPTCGATYEVESVYCQNDGTLLKERGN